jgi:hypothetical protein
MGMTLGIKGAKIQLGDREIEIAEKSSRGFHTEIGVVAFIRYYFGGDGVVQLRNAYPPDAYGDVLYSNLRVRTVFVQAVKDLAETHLEVEAKDRKRGLLWYLVAVSPKRPGTKQGTTIVNALIQGYWLDSSGEEKKLKVPARELKEPPPVLWLGVTDEGERVEWSDAIRKERQRHIVEAGKLNEIAKRRGVSKEA